MFGRPEPRKLALGVLTGVTLITFVVSGAEPVWRVLIIGRTNDGDFGARVVEGNGVTLVWAPEGPGWPSEGIEWDEAVRRCRYLNEDGLSLADEPQDIWRLPTVEEIVRSLTRRGENAGGVWDSEQGRATYRTRPDKESPLWDPRSPIIYWWAADEVDADHAYRVVYNGGVWLISRNTGMGSQAFRAVRDVAP